MKEVGPEQLAAILGSGKQTKTSDGWKTLCPSHPDKTPSLSIYRGKDGRWMVNCHSGCEPRIIYAAIEAMGYQLEGRQSPSRSTKNQSVTVIPAPQPYPDSVQHRLHGKPSAAYPYFTLSGELAFVVHRWNKSDGSKTILPFSCMENREGIVSWDWKLRITPGGRPLYNLPDIVAKRDSTILLVEGEKAAEAAKKTFPEYAVASWSGGVKNWKQTDMGPLKGREVLIWPDNDTEGWEGATALGTKLRAGGFCEEVKIAIVPKTWPKGWDLADPVPEGQSLANVRWIDAFRPSLEHALSQMDQHNYNEVLDDLYWLFDDGNSTYTVSKIARDMATGRPFSIDSSHAISKIRHGHEAITNKRVTRPDGAGMDHPLLLWRNEKRGSDRIRGFEFDPSTEEKIIEVDGAKKLNVFTGFRVQPSMDQSCDIFKDYVYTVLANSDKLTCDYIWNYLSHMFQRPTEKPPTCLIFRGRTGTGKSTLGRVIQGLLGGINGYCYTVPSMARLTDSFNSSLIIGRLCVFIQEIEVTRSKSMINKLKSFISDDIIEVNRKFMPQYAARNLTRVIGCTNHDFTISLEADDRRVSVLDTADDHRQDFSYFEELMRELESGGYQRLMWELLNFEVDNRLVYQPIETKARAEQIFMVNTPARDLAYRMLKDGEINLQILNERRESESTFYRDTEEWKRHPQVLPSKHVNSELDRMRQNYKEVYTPRDKRAKFGGVVSLLYPPDFNMKTVKWTTVANTYRGINTAVNVMPIPTLEECRRNFAQNVGLPYDDLFEEPSNVIDLPTAAKIDDVPF